MDEQNMITVENLSKTFKVSEKGKSGFSASLKQLVHRRYRYVKAVDNISMTVKKGEIRALIGPNGAGKSTTIKMISGVLHPSEGHVDVMGYVPWEDRKRYVRNIGVVMGQKSQLLWDLPALDTFALNREIYGISKSNYLDNVLFFEDLLNIGDIVKRPVRQLSLGERMKCELVCAMLHEPPLVYLDEPTIGLDLIAKESMHKFIRKINNEKKTTFILTTHNMDDVENLCENITIINKGIIVYDGNLQKLKRMISNKKVIEILLSQTVSRELFQSYDVIEYHPRQVKISLDLAKSDIKGVIYSLFDTLPCQDINVLGIGIEEIVKQVYQW